MLSRLHQVANRRRLLQFLATSPLLAHGAMPAFAQGTTSLPPDPLTWAPLDLNKLIENPERCCSRGRLRAGILHRGCWFEGAYTKHPECRSAGQGVA